MRESLPKIPKGFESVASLSFPPRLLGISSTENSASAKQLLDILKINQYIFYYVDVFQVRLDSSVAEFLLWVPSFSTVRGPGFKSQFSPLFFLFSPSPLPSLIHHGLFFLSLLPQILYIYIYIYIYLLSLLFFADYY